MSAAAHYRFPPAGAYPLNRCLYAIKSDAGFRARYVSDPSGAMEAMGLGEAERTALTSGDRDALVSLGAHPYLVFMADLRIKMDRGTTKFEYF